MYIWSLEEANEILSQFNFYRAFYKHLKLFEDVSFAALEEDWEVMKVCCKSKNLEQLKILNKKLQNRVLNSNILKRQINSIKEEKQK